MSTRTMRDSFLTKLLEQMETNPDLFFVTADFGSPVLDDIRQRFPDRFINVGIAEQNLINVCTGLALEGYRVYAYAIAPFITMRCYEQIRVNLALLSQVREMSVTLIGVGAGYSYVVSGPTHQCYEDISIMRTLPGIEVISPADHIAAADLFQWTMDSKKICYFRLDAQTLPVVYDQKQLQRQKGFHEMKSGNSLCLVATGYMVHSAIRVAEMLKQENISIGVIDCFNLTNFDHSSLKVALTPYQTIVTLEEGFIGRGGLDSVLSNFINEHKLNVEFHHLGIPHKYQFEIGSRAHLHQLIGLDDQSLREKIKRFI